MRLRITQPDESAVDYRVHTGEVTKLATSKGLFITEAGDETEYWEIDLYDEKARRKLGVTDSDIRWLLTEYTNRGYICTLTYGDSRPPCGYVKRPMAVYFVYDLFLDGFLVLLIQEPDNSNWDMHAALDARFSLYAICNTWFSYDTEVDKWNRMADVTANFTTCRELERQYNLPQGSVCYAWRKNV